MRRQQRVPFALAIVMAGCAPASETASPGATPCGEPPASWAGGYQRTGWRDEGGGYLSQMESNATDTPAENLGDPPSARILHCPTGQGVWIQGKQDARMSAFDFLDRIRAGKGFSDDLISPAKEQRLSARKTQANASSERALCGCRAYYPDLALPWAGKIN